MEEVNYWQKMKQWFRFVTFGPFLVMYALVGVGLVIGGVAGAVIGVLVWLTTTLWRSADNFFVDFYTWLDKKVHR